MAKDAAAWSAFAYGNMGGIGAGAFARTSDDPAGKAEGRPDEAEAGEHEGGEQAAEARRARREKAERQRKRILAGAYRKERAGGEDAEPPVETTATGVTLRNVTPMTHNGTPMTNTESLQWAGSVADIWSTPTDDERVAELFEEQNRLLAEEYEAELDLQLMAGDNAPGPTINVDVGRFFATAVGGSAAGPGAAGAASKELSSALQQKAENLCFCFARDVNRGGSVVMGRQDGGIVVAPTRKSGFGSEPVLLRGHRGAVRCLLALPRGCALPPSRKDAGAALLASGATDSTIIIWEPEQAWKPGAGSTDSSIVQTMRGHSGTVTALTRVGILLVSGATDRSVRVWRASPGRADAYHPWFECTYVLNPADGWINTLDFASSGRIDDPGALALGDATGLLRVHMAKLGARAGNGARAPVALAESSGAKVFSKQLPKGVLMARVWPDEEVVVVLCYDYTMRLYEMVSVTAPVHKAVVHNPAGCAYTGVDFDPVRRHAILVDREGYLSLYSFARGKVVYRSRVSDEPLLGVIYSATAPDDTLLCSTSRGVRYIHMLRDHPYIEGLDEGKGHVMSVLDVQVKASPPPNSMSPPEPNVRIFSVALDSRILQWDPVTSQIVREFVEERSEISSMLYCDMLHRIVTGHVDGVVRLWELETGSTCNLRELPVAVTVLCSANISSDPTTPEPRVFAGCANGQLALFDFSRRRGARPMLVSKLTAHENHSVSSIFHDTKRRLVFSGGSDGTIKMWHDKLLTPMGTFAEDDAGMMHMATCMAIDTSALLSGCEDGRVRVWDRLASKRGNTTFMVKKRASARAAVAVSPPKDGEEARVSSAETRQPASSSFVAHSGPIAGIAVSGRGRCVTCAEDGCVIAWLYGSGKKLHMCTPHPEPTTCLSLYLAAHLAVVGTASGAVLRFSLPKDVFDEGPSDAGNEIEDE